MTVVPSEETRGGKEEEAKLELTFFSKMPERARRRGTRKIIAFATEFLLSRRIDFARFRDEI